MPMKKLVLIGQTPDLGADVRQDAVRVVFDSPEIVLGGAQSAQIGLVLLPHEHRAHMCPPADARSCIPQSGSPVRRIPLFLLNYVNRLESSLSSPTRQRGKLGRQIAQLVERFKSESRLPGGAILAFALDCAASDR